MAESSVLHDQLMKLESATTVILMIIPEGVSFRTAMRDEDLSEVSCVYQIDNNGPSFKQVLGSLSASIINYELGYRTMSEPRVGIVFKNENATLQTFYFEDSEGHQDVKGVSGRYRIVALASLPNQLRTIASQRDVMSIKRGC